MLFQHAFNIVFNMHYRFQHTLKFSTCFFNTARFSIACTLCRSCIQTCPISNIVFNMHYRFQHVLKFSTCFFNTARFSVACTLCRSCIQTGPICSSFQHNFQHALQISTCTEIFNMLFQHDFNIVLNMKFTYGMNHVKYCVESHVKYFKVYWKPCWKFQGMLKTMSKISKCVKNHCDVTIMWPFLSILKHNSSN